MKKLGIDSIFYSAGILLNSLLGLVFFILVARALGPSEFGIFAVIITISAISTDIFDFGLNTSMLKFLSQEEDDVNKKNLAREFLSYKIISSLLVILLGLAVSPLITQTVFKNQVSWLLVWLGFVIAGVSIFYGYVNSNLQSRKRFVSSVLLNSLSNALRLTAACYFFFLGQLKIDVAVLLFLLPIILVAVIWGIIDQQIAFRPRLTKKTFLPIYEYGRWVAGSTALASIASRLDNFLLVNLSSTFQTGIYTSVQRFFLAFNQIPAGISLVTTPDLSSKDSQKTHRALKFAVGTSFLISIGLVVFILLASWIIPFLLGEDYRLSVVPSQYLAFGTIFFVLASPLNSFILYTREKSHFLFFLTFIQLLATVAFNLLLIPLFQAQGAAMAYAAVCLLSFIVSLSLFFRK